MAVNLGEDTDTVGAIAGGLAGLAYGYDAIPASWLDALLKKEELEAACRAFYPMVQGKQKRDSGEKVQRLLERLLTLWRGSGKGNSVIA